MSINLYIVNWIINFLRSKQQKVTANDNMTTFLPIDRVVPQGIIQGHIRFSVMLNNIQAVDSGRSTLVKFADDLTLLKCFSSGNPGPNSPRSGKHT